MNDRTTTRMFGDPNPDSHLTLFLILSKSVDHKPYGERIKKKKVND